MRDGNFLMTILFQFDQTSRQQMLPEKKFERGSNHKQLVSAALVISDSESSLVRFGWGQYQTIVFSLCSASSHMDS